MLLSLKVGSTLNESSTALLAFAVLPIAKVLMMCGLGLVMATSHIGILTDSARKQLSKLVMSLFLPCLIFTQLGHTVTLEKILEWWFIPVNVILASLVGCAIGYVVALLVRPPPQFFNFTVVMIGIGNIGNIPLVIIGAICRDTSNPFGNPDTCNSDGVAYICFGQWVGAVIMYTFVYQMLGPPTETDNDDVEKSCIGETLNSCPAKLVPYSALFGDKDIMIPLLGSSGKSVKVKERMTSILVSLRIHEILQPPVVAAFLALVIGATPFLKDMVFEEHGALFFMSDSLSIMGGAMIPCIMLALGGNLIGGADSSQLGLRTTIAIVGTRLLITPLAGLAVVTTADRFGLLPPNDKMFRFVLLLQHSMPSSILAGAVANLRGHADKEASAVLFYEHLCAVLSMAAWLVVYVNYLF